MKKIIIAVTLLAATNASTNASATRISADEAEFFGVEIVKDATCGSRSATLDLAKFLNKGASVESLKPFKEKILYGKKIAYSLIADNGKAALCGKDDSISEQIYDRAKLVSTLGYAANSDRLCGTRTYNAMMRGLKRRGELYAGQLKDYAEEFEEGKRTALAAFERDGETKYCRDARRREKEDDNFKRITRALGISEAPSYER